MGINIIITMAGLGSRFRKINENRNKQDIIANGRTLLEWSLLSLEDFYEEPFIFIAHKDRIDRNLLEDVCLRLGIYRKQLVILEHMTDGQATTALAAETYLDPLSPVMIFNIDTYLEKGSIGKKDLSPADAGFIPLFPSNDPRFSYASVEGKRIVCIREKVCISPYATAGLYYFRSFRLFQDAYRETYEKASTNEKYIAPLYQCLIDRGERVGYSLIDPLPHILGTPEELQAFCKHFCKDNSLS